MRLFALRDNGKQIKYITKWGNSQFIFFLFGHIRVIKSKAKRNGHTAHARKTRKAEKYTENLWLTNMKMI